MAGVALSQMPACWCSDEKIRFHLQPDRYDSVATQFALRRDLPDVRPARSEPPEGIPPFAQT